MLYSLLLRLSVRWLEVAPDAPRLAAAVAIAITVAPPVKMADRAKTKYGFALIPDEALSDPAQVVERAVAWLQTRT